MEPLIAEPITGGKRLIRDSSLAVPSIGAATLGSLTECSAARIWVPAGMDLAHSVANT